MGTSSVEATATEADPGPRTKYAALETTLGETIDAGTDQVDVATVVRWLHFPAAWLRGVVQDRLGIVPDEIDGGHCPALARPGELVERLESFRIEAFEAGRARADPEHPTVQQDPGTQPRRPG